jgi:hypothetical protein
LCLREVGRHWPSPPQWILQTVVPYYLMKE